MAVKSDLVWYDTGHVNAHVYRTFITEQDDGSVDVPVSGSIDSLRTEGVTRFHNQVEINGPFTMYTSQKEILFSPIGVDRNRAYVEYDNKSGATATVVLLAPVDEIRDVGGSFMYIKNVGPTVESIIVTPAHFKGDGTTWNDPYGVQLDVGEVIWLMWVNDGYRSITTNGTFLY